MINAFRNESQGGAGTDYRLWASDAQGVKEIYPYAKSGECSEIDLFIEATTADSTDGKGTPTAQIISDVEDVVNLDPDTSRPILERGRRPLTVIVNYLSITPKDVIITFVNPVGIDAAKETEIENSLRSAIEKIRPFVDSAEPLSEKNDILDINLVIAIAQSLLDSSQKFDSVTMTVDAVPVVTSITFINGDIPYLDQVNF